MKIKLCGLHGEILKKYSKLNVGPSNLDPILFIK